MRKRYFFVHLCFIFAMVTFAQNDNVINFNFPTLKVDYIGEEPQICNIAPDSAFVVEFSFYTDYFTYVLLEKDLNTGKKNEIITTKKLYYQKSELINYSQSDTLSNFMLKSERDAISIRSSKFPEGYSIMPIGGMVTRSILESDCKAFFDKNPQAEGKYETPSSFDLKLEMLIKRLTEKNIKVTR